MSSSRFRSHERVEYSRITPYVYIGTNLCCRAHAPVLEKIGAAVDIDLEYEHPTAERPGMEMTLYLPTRDHHAPTLSKLIVGTALVDTAVKAAKRVYVHCKNGHGRAPTLVAAYFMTQGMMPAEALALIKARRPVVHLNRIQMRALTGFARYLRSHRAYW